MIVVFPDHTHLLFLALQLKFVADNIILIFSQPNVNIIDTEINPINSLHISNKTKQINCTNIKKI